MAKYGYISKATANKLKKRKHEACKAAKKHRIPQRLRISLIMLHRF
jgi:hypothetical protein